MNLKLQSAGNKFTIALMVAVVATLTVISCTKTTQPAGNSIFVSDWVGTQRCWYSNRPDTTYGTNESEFIGAQSGADNLITIGWAFGYTDCYQAAPVIGTVNGNNFSIAPQNFSDRCGAGYLISGNGYLSADGTTLTMSTTVAGAYVTTCVFTGVKK